LASTSPFHPIQPSRISDEAVNQIKKLIDEGVFRPDDKLPSERELVQALSVSRTSVREALRVLEAMGYIEVLPGVGARVVDRRIGGELSSRWTDWMVEHYREVDELLEIREALEPKVAALAAERMSDEQLAAIVRTLNDMKQCAEANDVDGAVKADIEFHDLINLAARNELLAKLNDSINYVLLESRYAYFQDVQRISLSWEQHRRVVEALSNKDAQAAFAAMLEHVQKTRDRMRSLVKSREET